MSGEFLIYFDGIFWIGLFSVEKGGRLLRIGKFVFGSEPNSAEVYEWLCKGAPGLHMQDLSGNYETVLKQRIKNPKRVLREVRKSQTNVKESHAQKCMREELELSKKSSAKSLREKHKEAELRKFNLRCEKRKKKQRGR